MTVLWRLTVLWRMTVLWRLTEFLPNDTFYRGDDGVALVRPFEMATRRPHQGRTVRILMQIRSKKCRAIQSWGEYRRVGKGRSAVVPTISCWQMFGLVWRTPAIHSNTRIVLRWMSMRVQEQLPCSNGVIY